MGLVKDRGRTSAVVGSPASVHGIGERSVGLLGRQTWLDRPSYRLEHVLGLVRAGGGGAGDRIGNLLHGTWLGHPLHPLLTGVPTGAVATTVVLDLAAVLPGRATGLREAARLSLGVGILGSVAAAATGLSDWQHTQEESRRVGLVHGGLNGVATGLYVLSWWDRRQARNARGAAMSALGYGITMAAGYLGGDLVFRSAIGVDRSGPRLATGEWTPVLSSSALLAGEPQQVEAAGVGVVLFRDSAEIWAVGEYCPHLGAPMADGWVDRGFITCPWHVSRFQPDTGKVLQGPATAPLPCYQTRVRNGMVEVRGGLPGDGDEATGEGR